MSNNHLWSILAWDAFFWHLSGKALTSDQEQQIRRLQMTSCPIFSTLVRVLLFALQVVRYCFQEGAKPLWPYTRPIPKVNEIPCCPKCQGPRRFEFEVSSTLSLMLLFLQMLSWYIQYILLAACLQLRSLIRMSHDLHSMNSHRTEDLTARPEDFPYSPLVFISASAASPEFRNGVKLDWYLLATGFVWYGGHDAGLAPALESLGHWCYKCKGWKSGLGSSGSLLMCHFLY